MKLIGSFVLLSGLILVSCKTNSNDSSTKSVYETTVASPSSPYVREKTDIKDFNGAEVVADCSLNLKNENQSTDPNAELVFACRSVDVADANKFNDVCIFQSSKNKKTWTGMGRASEMSSLQVKFGPGIDRFPQFYRADLKLNSYKEKETIGFTHQYNLGVNIDAAGNVTGSDRITVDTTVNLQNLDDSLIENSTKEVDPVTGVAAPGPRDREESFKMKCQKMKEFRT